MQYIRDLSVCVNKFENTWKFKKDGVLRCSEEPTGLAMNFFEGCGSFLPKDLQEQQKSFEPLCPLSYLSEEDVKANKISMLQHFSISYVAYLDWCKALNVEPIDFSKQF